MEHDLSYYQKVQGLYDVKTRKEATVRKARKAIDRDWRKNINWNIVTIKDSHGKCREQNLKIIKTSDANKKKIWARPEQLLRLGDVISWKHTKWLVTELDPDNLINYHGSMSQSNFILRWQDSEGVIHTEYGWDEDKSGYSHGESYTQYLKVPDFASRVLVQLNDDTLKIKRGDRFLQGPFGEGRNPITLETTRVNYITNTYFYDEDTCQEESGLVELILSEVQFNSDTDSPDLLVADYKDPTEEEVPTEGGDNEGWWF